MDDPDTPYGVLSDITSCLGWRSNRWLLQQRGKGGVETPAGYVKRDKQGELERHFMAPNGDTAIDFFDQNLLRSIIKLFNSRELLPCRFGKFYRGFCTPGGDH